MNTRVCEKNIGLCRLTCDLYSLFCYFCTFKNQIQDVEIRIIYLAEKQIVPAGLDVMERSAYDGCVKNREIAVDSYPEPYG